MSRILLAAGAAVILAVSLVSVSASDRVAVYGRVDRVSFEPNADTPDTVQVYGVFSIGIQGNPNDYQPARAGYLYYKVSREAQTTRREWADLKQVAGTNQIVAFGLRWDGVPKLHAAAEQPANPDPYTLNTGVVKVKGRTDYAPVRAIVEFTP